MLSLVDKMWKIFNQLVTQPIWSMQLQNIFVWSSCFLYSYEQICSAFQDLLDYEVDSDDEWEEEEPGESLSNSEVLWSRSLISLPRKA